MYKYLLMCISRQDYIALDMDAALVAGGFSQPLKMNNTPRHKTVVALKV